MKKQLPKRSEVDVAYTWDVSNLFKTEEDYEKAVEKAIKDVDAFANKFEGKLVDAQTIVEAIDEMRKLQESFVVMGSYQSLNNSTDSTDEKNQMRSGNFMLKFQALSQKMTFFSVELNKVDIEVLNEAKKINPEFDGFLDDIIRERPHILTPDAEKALAALSPTLNAAYGNYQRFKLADMKFPDFEVDGEKHPNSFTLFENEWEYDKDAKLRRKAYEAFYETLGQYQNGLANNYQSHVLKEKALSSLQGFDSVYDYLLFE